MRLALECYEISRSHRTVTLVHIMIEILLMVKEQTFTTTTGCPREEESSYNNTNVNEEKGTRQGRRATSSRTKTRATPSHTRRPQTSNKKNDTHTPGTSYDDLKLPSRHHETKDKRT